MSVYKRDKTLLYDLVLNRGVAGVARLGTRLSALLVLFCGLMHGQSIPNIDLSATVRQVDGDVKAEGVHVLRLLCEKGACILVTVTLNQCVPVNKEVKLSTPKIELSSTAASNLRVKPLGGNEIEVSETGTARRGDYTATFRFTYERKGAKTTVTGLSGAFVKNSDLLKKIIAVKYESVPGGEFLELACPMFLPGTEEGN